jgi:hypothetical protein
VTEAVRILVSGLPAEIVREIGLRLRGVTVSDFENTQQMGRAAGQGDARLLILSDALPVQDSIYIARRARDARDDVRIAYCISMEQVEAIVHTLDELQVDRFFLSPVDVEEILVEVSGMCRVEVLFFLTAYGLGTALTAFTLILEEGSFRRYQTFRDRALLFGRALLENLGYRQMTVFWRLRGLWKFVLGRKEWDAMERKGFQKPVSIVGTN